MGFSVVIPVYQEADSIGPLVEEIFHCCDDGPDHLHELIVVDDGSTDGTDDQLLSLARQTDRLRVLRHGHNSGQSAALLTGIRSARTDWVVTLDGDGQNDPADIARLIHARDAAVATPDLVIGRRERRRDTPLRRLASRVANAVRARLLADETTDTGCGLKLFPRELFLSLPHFDHMHRFMPALVRRANGHVLTVAVGHRPRVHGQSKYGIFNRLGVGIVDLFGVAWLQRRNCSVNAREL